MRNTRLKKILWRNLLAGAVLGARAVLAQSTGTSPGGTVLVNNPPGDDWSRHFRIGGFAALNLKASFSATGPFSVAGNSAGPVGVSGANHVYDDGYVRVDQTGDAQGFTSFWGYTSAAQIDAADHLLLMHAASAYSLNGGGGENAGPLPGFDMAYGGNFWNVGWAQVGWEAGAGLLPVKISQQQTMPAAVTQSTFSFNTGTIVVPTAPYNGGSSGQGANIQDIATAAGTTIVPGTVSSSQTLDVMLYNLRLGPTINFNLGTSFGLELGAGPAVGIVSGDLKFNDAITTANGTSFSSGKTSSTDFVFGGYANATVLYHAVPGGDIYLGAQFMPLGNARLNGNGREGELKLGGRVYITAGFNWPF